MAGIAVLPDRTEAEKPRKIITKKDRQRQRVKLLIIALVAAGTAIYTVVDLITIVKVYNSKLGLNEKIQLKIKTASLIHDLQKERGLTALFMVSNYQMTKAQDLKLRKFREETNQSVMALEYWSNTYDNKSFPKNQVAFLKLLQDFRNKINKKDEDISVERHLKTYSEWVDKLISWLPNFTVSENLENYSEFVYSYQMVTKSKEESGLERALGGMYFLEGNNFSTYNISWYNDKRIRAKSFLEAAFSFSHEVEDIYNSLFKLNNGSSFLHAIEKKRQRLIANNVTNPSQHTAQQWFDLMTLYNNLMLKLQTKVSDLIHENVEEETELVAKSLIQPSLLLFFTLFLLPLLIISLFKVQNEFYQYTLTLYDRVGLEQGRTEFLMNENARYVKGE